MGIVFGVEESVARRRGYTGKCGVPPTETTAERGMADIILCTMMRAQILALAKRLADDGAHYLWGAEAHKPTRSAKHLYAPVVLSKDRADESCFCAAKLLVQGELYVCAGRCLHPDLAKVSPQTKVVNSGK